ncbi:MAG: acetyl-CoA carboxylase carboxyltransferase subunit beta [Bacteroidetes bacterium]|nr:acetyl-CoA carboxylase carboxyltransferase subunit beta [Bacteroidota bacterium]
MSWFSRQWIGITTRQKKEIPEGIWHQCPDCKKALSVKEHEENLRTCPHCNFHDSVSPDSYFNLLFDSNEGELLFEDIVSKDFLDFTDLKPYDGRLKSAIEKTGETDAIKVASGKIDGNGLVIAAMDFAFIGGSMGSVVGERIARSVDHCIANKLPLLIISQSGGARMMESAFSLMQMAKTSAKLTQLSAAQLPFLSLMTHPTTGGVTASFAMLGDINMAEPKALIGFAGPRVIKETIKRDLPEGFQRSEFLIEKGFLDLIVHRKVLKQQLSKLLRLLS